MRPRVPSLALENVSILLLRNANKVDLEWASIQACRRTQGSWGWVKRHPLPKGVTHTYVTSITQAPRQLKGPAPSSPPLQGPPMAFAISPSLQRAPVSVAVPTSVASPSLTLSKATAMSPLDLQGSSTTCYEGPLHMPGVTRGLGVGGRGSENTQSQVRYPRLGHCPQLGPRLTGHLLAGYKMIMGGTDGANTRQKTGF